MSRCKFNERLDRCSACLCRVWQNRHAIIGIWMHATQTCMLRRWWYVDVCTLEKVSASSVSLGRHNSTARWRLYHNLMGLKLNSTSGKSKCLRFSERTTCQWASSRLWQLPQWWPLYTTTEQNDLPSRLALVRSAGRGKVAWIEACRGMHCSGWKPVVKQYHHSQNRPLSLLDMIIQAIAMMASSSFLPNGRHWQSKARIIVVSVIC